MIMFSLKLTGKVPFTEVFCHGLIRDSDGRKMSKSLGNVIDPIDILDGISLEDLHRKLQTGDLASKEVKNAERYQKKAFPQGIPEIGADALRFSLVNYTQSSGGDINFDIKTMHSYRRFCNKIYQATKYVLGKLGDDFVPRESASLTAKESLPEKWILTKMNTAVKEINQALGEREFAKSTQVAYRYLYDELFDIYIENSKSIISSGTPTQARSAMDTLYTALETGLRLLSPFMPFLTEEMWQRLPRRPGESFRSITVAHYPEHEPSFDDPKSETAYELILGCSKGIRSLLSDYAIKDQGLVYIAPLNEESYLTAHSHLSAIQSLCGKIPVFIKIMKVDEPRPQFCAVFPCSVDANVYLEISDRVHDTAKEVAKLEASIEAARHDLDDVVKFCTELGKVQDKEVADTIRAADRRKQVIEARLRALQDVVADFKAAT
jgi:valyl-tRNA synthetase